MQKQDVLFSSATPFYILACRR